MNGFRINVLALLLAAPIVSLQAQVVPQNLRGSSNYERQGFHDANNIRTEFWNYGMVGNYPADPLNVDVSVFHSVEVPKGSGVNYSDGITPFILSKITQANSNIAYIMETGYRERQGTSPYFNRIMRFEPRPGYFQPDPAINRGRSPAISSDTTTWPETWPDRDTTWNGAWDGYFGKRPAADQESFTVMDDDYYDAWDYHPDVRDLTRHGLGMRVEVRGFQWANPQAGNVIFWHYDITNESTTDYDGNVIFGLYMDSGVGGEAISCDGIAESDDDNAYFDASANLNLVYTWDVYGHGVGLGTICAPTGYLGYAYLETPGQSRDGVDNDNDGMTDEARDSGPGTLIVGQGAISSYVNSHYNMTKFVSYYGKLEDRPAFRAGRWWTGDEDLDWTAELNDVGTDGVRNTHDPDGTEGNGRPDPGEPNFDKTDVDESDMIGLTGFKMNRIKAGAGNPNTTTDGIVFFTDPLDWPHRLYEKFSAPNPPDRFDSAVAANYNIGFLFASGPFNLPHETRERFSLALAYGADLVELRTTVKVVQAIYKSNYQFAQPPPMPTVRAEAGDHYVQLYWDDVGENGYDEVARINDFEGYRVYRATDPEFRDVKVILSGRGTTPIGNGKTSAQYDLVDGIRGYSEITVEGVAYFLGVDNGLTHSWRDTTVVNGREYYYAVTSYDYGPTIVQGGAGFESFTYYPSENAIAVSRTVRGGIVLPKNVVLVRPNPKVPGFVPASASDVARVAGNGTGTVTVKRVNSDQTPDNHIFKISFTADPDSVHAGAYTLTDSTTGQVLFTTGNVFDGSERGQVAAGVMPIIYTIPTIEIDTIASGFTASSPTNADLDIKYYTQTGSKPINYRRTGFPYDLTVTFSNVPIDTSVGVVPLRPLPVKFSVVAHTPTGDTRLKFFFLDKNKDSTLSHIRGGADFEEITVLTGPDSVAPAKRTPTWTIRLKGDTDSTRTPTLGDVYQMYLKQPFMPGDVFAFTTTGKSQSLEAGTQTYASGPYVVPNPYVGAASFEPAPYGVQGRGDRRIEFRNIPKGCTIRIFTVRGDLVQTLTHDGTDNGYVAWNLRTKDNLDVAPGLYVYHVQIDGGSDYGTRIGKFAIIK
jgi:hypothetical protein